MIKNERQYKISKAAKRNFQNALESTISGSESNIDPILADASSRAMLAQLSDLEAEIYEYEKLKSGELQIESTESLDELPLILIRARIAKGLTQKDLAKQLDISPQQIQRYEESNYNSVSFSRLLDIAKALDIDTRNTVLIGASEATGKALLKSLSAIGLSDNFIKKRLIPRGQTESHSHGPWIGTLLEQLHRIYNWEPTAVLKNPNNLTVNMQPAYATRFKVSKARNDGRTSAYTIYANYLAMLLVDQMPTVDSSKLPNSAESFYDNIAILYGELNLETSLRYIWSLGIAVLPLQDEGSFDGAYWRTENKHVIALKPSSKATARWLFDLLHDYFHATQHPNLAENDIVELPPTDHRRIDDPDEIEANEFASEVIVAGQGDCLWSSAFEQTEGNLAFLKNKLPFVARECGVDVGVAAYYMANRLMINGENWWGAAENLQSKGEQPWNIALDLFLENIDLSILPKPDKDLLQAALGE